MRAVKRGGLKIGKADELMAMFSGRQKQKESLQRERAEREKYEQQRNVEKERMRRFMDAISLTTLRMTGTLVPDFTATRRGELPSDMTRPTPTNNSSIEDQDNEDFKKHMKSFDEAAAARKKVDDEERKKREYQPGMSIGEYVTRHIEIEKDKERLKWLKTFNSCVLPDDVRETIEEALTTVLMAKKFDEWGVNESFEKGLTNSILLYGPPGTGKTMIAESFAAVLGKNLLKVTNADIQSQIPGEAERNISANFEEAKKQNCVLMFDECDSLLYDRNAVGMIMASEINHLLTEIERFDGVCILTTNRLERLDPALQRRIIAKVELPLPDEKARFQIWKNLVPKKVPIADDVDFSLLAKFEVSGGEIKNIILTAIRKAVAKNEAVVTAEHFATACRSIFKAKKDFESNRARVVAHEDITPYASMGKTMDLRKVQA